MKKYIIGLILVFASTSFAQGVGNHKRYEINIRVAKPLPSVITNNLTAISNSLDKIKVASRKIKNYEKTDTWVTDNTNAGYRSFTASFAMPYPLPQAFVDEQATFEGYLMILSNNAMPSSGTYNKKVQSHICNNGLTPTVSCSGVTDY